MFRDEPREFCTSLQFLANIKLAWVLFYSHNICVCDFRAHNMGCDILILACLSGFFLSFFLNSWVMFHAKSRLGPGPRQTRFLWCACSKLNVGARLRLEERTVVIGKYSSFFSFCYWIMPLFVSGSIHQGHEMFGNEARGRQCAFLALNAILY